MGLNGGVAAVNQQLGAGGIAGGIAGKVQVGAGNVLWRAHAFLRGAVYPALQFIAPVRHHFCGHIAGA